MSTVFSVKHKRHYFVASLVLIFALLFFLIADAGHDEPRLIVMGDSLSTTHESWPGYLREIASRWNVQVMAQNGRTIRDFSIPRDLWTAGDKHETVIYFLGGNDILQRNDVVHARYRLQSHISFLLERNFKVLLLTPPTLGVDPQVFGKANREHRALIESYRGTHANLWVYDMDNVWNTAQTHDGVHPSAELSREVALAINKVLALRIY
jgi:hypothetical protein